MTAEQAIRDPYFHDLRELDKRMTMQLSGGQDHYEKTENEEDSISHIRKIRKHNDNPIKNKLPKISQVPKGSDDESDNENTSINLPKINNNQTVAINSGKIYNTYNNTNKNFNLLNPVKTLQAKKNSLNTNNSNSSLQNNKIKNTKHSFKDQK